MTQQLGANTGLILGFEDVAYGTAATAGFDMPYNYPIGLKGSQALNKSNTRRSNRNPATPYRGSRNVAGPISFPIDSLACAYWLKLMFGAGVSNGEDAETWIAETAYVLTDGVIPTVVNGYWYECTTAGTTGVSQPTWGTTVGGTTSDGTAVWTCRNNIHEFKVGSTQPSGSIELQFEDLETPEYLQYLGCKAGTFGIAVSGEGNSELIGTINLVGASEAFDTDPFDATPTTISLARLNHFQAAILEGGSSLAIGTDLSINLDFGLDTSRYCIGGSGIRRSLPEGIIGVSGNIKTLFEDLTMINKAIAGTESSLKLTVTGSVTSVFELEMQELMYERNAPDVPGPVGLMADLNFQGYYENGAEASAIVARLINTVLSY